MSLSEAALPMIDRPAGARDLIDAAEQLTGSLQGTIAAGSAGAFPDQTMRRLMAVLVRIYAAKFDEGQCPALLDADSEVSATAVLVTASALMKSANLEIFELGMWQSWSGTR